MKIVTMCKEITDKKEIRRRLIYDKKKLIIQTPFSKINDICIPVENLLECECDTETKLVQKDKSVIGRAIAGGLFFGGVGAVVGGISGTGQKTKRQYERYLTIAYLHDEETEVRIFKAYPGESGIDRIAKAFNKEVNDED